MAISRREFLRDGATAFAVGLTAPALLGDIARAQGTRGRSLVVLYLSGGNDALSTVIPYQDPFYASRRPTIGISPGRVLQIGSDSSGRALGLHPRLTGLHDLFNAGRLAIIQRTGYVNSSRSHFQGIDIYGTADPVSSTKQGWLGRYLEGVPANPLAAWNASVDLPRALVSRRVSVPTIPDARSYAFSTPGTSGVALGERAAAAAIASHMPADRPLVAFVNGIAREAFETLDRVASVAAYGGTVAYPNTGLGAALRTVAGAIVRGVGTRVYWVQAGGYDTHASQGVNGGGAYGALMATLGDSVLAFYNDLRNQRLADETLLLQFSEFGRRVSENGSGGTDHGAGGVMMAVGGAVRGGIYGTAASLDPSPGNPTLENGGADVAHETDFRGVYARVLDHWLGTSSTSILGKDFSAGAPAIV
jgi:uncharacterized protein (DUF1501 family)